jgi:hypothetical protein
MEKSCTRESFGRDLSAPWLRHSGRDDGEGSRLAASRAYGKSWGFYGRLRGAGTPLASTGPIRLGQVTLRAFMVVYGTFVPRLPQQVPLG